MKLMQHKNFLMERGGEGWSWSWICL